MNTKNNKVVKRFNKFVEKYNAFVVETGDINCTLYEDMNTPYYIEDIKVLQTRIKFTTIYNDYRNTAYDEVITDEYDLEEWVVKLNADLRRAKRYWEMPSEDIDAISDGYKEDVEDEE